MALLRPKHGPHMVLQIGSSWILIIVPRDVTRQISHCWVFPVAPLPKNGQNMALLWQNMVHTWSSPSWPKHGLHLVLKIGSTWILINMPRDVPCQISHCRVYPVVPCLKNSQNMALLLPKHGPHRVFQIGSFWISITMPRVVSCQISHCWVYPVAPLPKNYQKKHFYGLNMVLTWSFKLDLH